MAERLRDWSAGRGAIDRVQASCWAVDEDKLPVFRDVDRGFGQFRCDYQVKTGGDCDEPSVGAAGRSAGSAPQPIIDWTTDSIRRLTA